jgi:hypothetical protein
MARELLSLRIKQAHSVVVALGCAVCAQSASAQTSAPDQQAEPQLPSTITEPTLKPRPAEPPSRVDESLWRAPSERVQPRTVGSFYLYPQFEAGIMYDDNVFYSNNDKRRDWALVVSPMVWVQSQWAQHALNFYGSADFTRYEEYDSEDSNDYRGGVEGRRDLGDRANVYGGVYAAREHEDRESPEDLNGITPTDYRQYRYYAGFFKQFNQVSVRIAGTAMQLDFDDVDFRNNAGVINAINNDDRDRWQYTGGIKLGYRVASGQEAYFQVAADNRRYKSSVDDLGVGRDSDGQRVLVGFRWMVPNQVKLDGYVGYMRQDYEDSRSATISEPTAGLAMSLQTRSRGKYFVVIDRTIEETTVTRTVAPGQTIFSPGYTNTYITAGIQQPIATKLMAKLSGAFSRAEFEGLDRRDDYRSISAGLSYFLTSNVILDADFSHRSLRSSVSTEDFDKNMATLKVVVPF